MNILDVNPMVIWDGMTRNNKQRGKRKYFIPKCNGSVTWRGISLLDLGEALNMSKMLGKIKVHLFLGQVLNLPEE